MPLKKLDTSTQLDAEMRRSLLRVLWRSRLGDLREQSLIRQGKGWFHISGMGHEALAAIAIHLEATCTFLKKLPSSNAYVIHIDP
jgi:TPP-dependent pyruvate/acetoin dehydrogenase alpha subunit